MTHLVSYPTASYSRAQNQLAAINTTIANSMLGRVVSLRVGAQAPTHGVVAGVVVEGATPKLVVNGCCYDLGQVLTVTPATLN